VADVGTGSGCIVLSLALARPDAVYAATDVSGAALDLARENASAWRRRRGGRIPAGDLLEASARKRSTRSWRTPPM